MLSLAPAKRRRWYLALGFVSACGSSPKTSPPVPEVAPESSAEPETTSNPEPAKPLHKVPTGESPIQLPNGLVYEGYVIGGLPTKAAIDAALTADIESAMSLMSRDEPGISEIGPYAASQGFRYIRFTIDGSQDLTEAMAWEFAATLPMLDKPGIVHSAQGQRVAAIFALKAFFVDDLPADHALAIGNALGMGEYAEHVESLIAVD